MLSINYTELRKSLKKNLDLTSDNHETLIVHRPNGKSVVVLSLEDYNSMAETDYLLSSKANADRLHKSIEDVKAGKNLIAFDPTA
ncbi:MAG: type II toxin-antitoxin system Phd/YefM family antitoxin [Flavobacterium sp.]|nr:type II toxin-antitoxin system Phd/YefM family antitoxin [Flavobacterium sp.]